MGFAEEWAAAEPLPELPAHPRCRCTIRSVFRDVDGNVFGTATTARPPALPEDGAIAQAEAAAALYDEKVLGLEDFGTLGKNIAPVLRNAIARGDPSVDAAFVSAFPQDEVDAYRANRDFWRSVEVTPEVMNDVTSNMGRFMGFMNYRYGTNVNVTTDASAGYFDQPQRIEALKAIERLRANEPRYVTDSPRFNTFVLKNLSGTTLASCANDGTINYDAKKGSDYVTKGIRADNPNVSGIEEILLHELGHSVANRYGEPHWNGSKGITYGRTLDTGPYSYPVEAGYFEDLLDSLPNAMSLSPEEAEKALAARQRAGTSYEITDKSKALFTAWEKIRLKTSKDQKAAMSSFGYLSLDSLKASVDGYDRDIPAYEASIARHQAELDEAIKRKAEVDAENERLRAAGTHLIDSSDLDYTIRVARAQVESTGYALEYSRKRRAAMMRDYTAALAASQGAPKMPTGETWSTSYGKGSPWEDWAESFMLFQLNPSKLLSDSPSRFDYFKKNIFAGKEFERP